MRIIIIYMLILAMGLCYAQPSIEWQHSIGGAAFDNLRSIYQTSDGGYLVTGESSSNNGDVSGNHGGYDLWVVKLDSLGLIEWQNCLGGSRNDKGLSGQQTTDGGYILAGYTTSSDGDVSGWHESWEWYDEVDSMPIGDCWVVKLSSSGEISWQRCLGGIGSESGESIQETADGGYILAGSNSMNDGDVSGNHGAADFWIVKLNSSGEIDWQQSLGGSNFDLPYSICQTIDRGYIVVGRSSSEDGDVSGNHGGYDFWVVKLDSLGVIEWEHCLGGSEWEEPKSIQQTSDGGYIITGESQSNDGDIFGNHGYHDFWVVKLDSSGLIDWQNCLGGSESDWGGAMDQTTDGGYIVAGETKSNDGDVSGNHGYRDFWVAKLDIHGSIEWQICLGGSDWDGARDIKQTNDGGYIVAGRSRSEDGNVTGNHGNYDFWVVKLSSYDGIEEELLPGKFSISVFPNPFNSSVNIQIATVGAYNLTPLHVEIYDINGTQVFSVGSGSGGPNTDHRLQITLFSWQPSPSIPSGIYLVRLKAGNFKATKRIVYLK